MRMSGPDIIGLTRELCAIPTSVVDPNNRSLFNRIAQELPLRLFEFPSGSEHNGWVVPQAWQVENATIKKDGGLIYDGGQGRLGVAQNSNSFRGRLTRDELMPHLYTNPALPPDARVWHTSWLYRPWQTDWGMTPERRIVEALGDGQYDIDLQCQFSDGQMLVADYHLPGKDPATFVIQSHTCHPHMANDGLSSAVIAIRLMQWLAGLNNQYSYRLVLAPEHVGTIFYLAGLPDAELRHVVGGVFPEMFGTKAPIVMGRSFWGNSYLDAVFEHVGRHSVAGFRSFPFRQTVGNDETVWDSAGIEVPMVQINRCEKFQFPFPEYHSTLDTPDILDTDNLDEAFRYLKNCIEAIEADGRPQRRFLGLLSLSNPKHNLYRVRVDPSLSNAAQSKMDDRWGYFQDCVTRYMDNNMSVLEIAERHGLSFFEVLAYLKRFEAKGLLEFHPRKLSRHQPFNVTPVEHSWED